MSNESQIKKNEIQELLNESAPTKHLLPTEETVSNITQLPLWPEAARAVPNDLARSALFSVQNRQNSRAYLKSQPIASFGETEILYTGEQLRQDDEDVYLQLNHFCRSKDMNEPICFRPSECLKALGWPRNGHYYKKLREHIERLSSNTILVKSKNGLYGGSLIRKFAFRPDDSNDSSVQDELSSGMWAIWLEPEVSQLFQKKLTSLVDWEERLSLSNLSKWLYSYYKGHAEPFPIKVQTFYEKMGSTAKKLFHFRANLLEAHHELKEKTNVITDYWLDETDKVHVRRPPRLRESVKS